MTRYNNRTALEAVTDFHEAAVAGALWKTALFLFVVVDIFWVAGVVLTVGGPL